MTIIRVDPLSRSCMIKHDNNSSRQSRINLSAAPNKTTTMSVSPSPDPPGATSSSSAPLSITTVAPTNQSISDAELVKHTTPQSLWLKIHGRVYDFSRFVDKHPGGKAILLKWGGKDATKTFSAVHNQDLLGANLPAEVVDLGESEGATTKQVVDGRRDQFVEQGQSRYWRGSLFRRCCSVWFFCSE